MNIKEIIEEIKELENYSDYNKATKKTFNKTKEYFGEMPEDMQEFYKNFNGGLLFLQNFCTIDIDDEYYDFEVMNDPEFKKMNYVPENVIDFVDTGYGDMVGYDKDKKQIVQINPEEEEESWIKWENFTQFLQEFMQESKKLIEEGILEPLR